MPDLTVVVSGTTTGIGKTWVTARIIEALRASGVAVSAHKPAQSFDPSDSLTDAHILAGVTDSDVLDVCPIHRWYARALAPPMAAAHLGHSPFSMDALVAELRMPVDGIAMIEGVGGPRSPLADDGDTVALAQAVDTDLVVLVADAELGAINAVLLSAEAFAPHRVIVVLNRFSADDSLHTQNLVWLKDRAGLEIVTTPQEAASILHAEISRRQHESQIATR